MKKRIIIILALVSLVACSKNEDKKKDPMAPKKENVESQQVQEAKDAAQAKEKKDKADAEAKAKAANGDKAQPTPTDGEKKDPATGTPTPAPTATSPAPTTVIPPSGAPAPEPTKDATTGSPQTDAKPDAASGAKDPSTDNQGQSPAATDGATPPQAVADGTTPPAAGDAATPPTADANPQAGKEVEPPQIPTVTTPDIEVASPTASTSYLSDKLSLVIPHKANWGWIKIEGADGEKLFNTLQIKSGKHPGNTVWNQATTKKGTNVSCFRQAKKATPKVNEYTCSLYIDYRKGTIFQVKDAGKLNLRIPALNQNYDGEMLYMSAANKGKFSRVKLFGEDAKAIYTNLEMEATPYEGGTPTSPLNRKKGESMECFEAIVKKDQGEQKAYSCSVYFNYSNGTALKIAK